MRLFCLTFIGGREILAPSPFPLWKFYLYRNIGGHFHVSGMQPRAPPPPAVMLRQGCIRFSIGIARQSARVLALCNQQLRGRAWILTPRHRTTGIATLSED